MLGRSLVSVNFPVLMTKYLAKEISLRAERFILETWVFSRFLLCIQFRTPAYGTVLPTLSVGLPPSVKYPWKHPHRHAQECVP